MCFFCDLCKNSTAAALVDPAQLYEIWPGLQKRAENSVLFSQLLSGIVPALIFTTFFSFCPLLFKAIANFGSNATSVHSAGMHGQLVSMGINMLDVLIWPQSCCILQSFEFSHRIQCPTILLVLHGCYRIFRIIFNGYGPECH